MAVNLQKGQKVDLTKGNPGLKNIIVGLGWDAAQPKGFFKKTVNIDCDASVIVCNNEGKLAGSNDLVYYGNLRHYSNSITHMGDNLTGDGDGDDEQIMINLSNIGGQYSKLVFVVNIYQCVLRKQHFGMVKNAYIRVLDADKREELCRYNLSEGYDGMTAMVFGEVYRSGSEWKFNAVGQPTNDPDLKTLVKRFM